MAWSAPSGAKLQNEAPVNGGRNYGWTTVVVKSGYMLGHPVNPALLATKWVAVTMRPVRAISREGSSVKRLVTLENPQRLHAGPGSNDELG